MHFSWLVSNKAYFKLCYDMQNSGCHFFLSIPTIYSTIVLDDYQILFYVHVLFLSSKGITKMIFIVVSFSTGQCISSLMFIILHT